MRYDTRILRFLFPSILFSTSSTGIHLTFDDGPHPVTTPKVLKILRERNIHVMFFLLGKNVQHYPDIAKQIKAEGHHCANHSYSHANLFFRNAEFIKREIIQSEEIMERTLGDHINYFRPPYGYFNLTILNVLHELNLTCTLWRHDSKDYRLDSIHEISRRITNKLIPGSILLFHDNEYTVQKVDNYLPALLDTLLEKGFIFNKLAL